MPLCRIIQITAPESAATGESIMVGGTYLNEGADGDCYTKLTVLNTGEVHGSDRFVPSQTSHGLSMFMTMPAKNLRLKIEVGEGTYLNPSNVQDSADFTVLNPEAPPPPTPAESLLPAIASAIAGALAVIWGLSPG